jgi:hypothetical protein
MNSLSIAKQRQYCLEIRDTGIWFRRWHTITLTPPTNTVPPPAPVARTGGSTPYRVAPQARVPSSVTEVVEFDECEMERCFNIEEQFVPWEEVSHLQLTGSTFSYDSAVRSMERNHHSTHRAMKKALLEQEQSFRMFLKLHLKNTGTVTINVPLEEEQAQNCMQECIARLTKFKAVHGVR